VAKRRRRVLHHDEPPGSVLGAALVAVLAPIHRPEPRISPRRPRGEQPRVRLGAGLAQRLKDGETRQLGSVDGYTGPGFGRFFTFICSRQSALITCRNALGDAMRYRPDAASK